MLKMFPENRIELSQVFFLEEKTKYVPSLLSHFFKKQISCKWRD